MHYLVAKTLADELTTTYGRLLMVPRRKTANWRGKENDKKGLYRKR